MDWVKHHFTQLGVWAANPWTFALAALYVGAWWYASPATFDWHAGATITTLFLALSIQRSVFRDTQALHAKLDELLRSHPTAKTELAQLDDKEPEDIQLYRESQKVSPVDSAGTTER